MEASRVTLIALLCVVFSQKKISGAEVEVRVRPGDDVILYCDCVIPTGSYIVWFRNCSHENQLPFVLNTMDSMRLTIARFSFVENSTSKSFDLRIKNVSEKDLGLHYCARTDQEVTTGGMIDPQTKMQYGKWTTHLSLIEEACPLITPIPTICDGPADWISVLRLSVYPWCIFLQLCLLCLYCWKARASEKKGMVLVENDYQISSTEVHQCEKTLNGEWCYHTEVCYTYLNP